MKEKSAKPRLLIVSPPSFKSSHSMKIHKRHLIDADKDVTFQAKEVAGALEINLAGAAAPARKKPAKKLQGVLGLQAQQRISRKSALSLHAQHALDQIPRKTSGSLTKNLAGAAVPARKKPGRNQ